MGRLGDLGTITVIALLAFVFAVPRLNPWLQSRGIPKWSVFPVGVALFAAASWFTYRELIGGK